MALSHKDRVDQFKMDPDKVVEALAKIGEQMKHNPEKAAEVFAAIFRNVSEGRAYK